MPQYPFAVTTSKNPSGKQVQASSDAQGAQLVSSSLSTKLNVTAAAVVKATPGRLKKIIVINPGTTSGGLVVNDAATVGGATTANQLFNIAYNASTMFAGAVFDLDIECAAGIVVSAVAGGGTPQYAFTYS